MKSSHAAHFVNQHMHTYQLIGSLPYVMWQEFVAKFVAEFCPKNKVQTAHTKLETLKYFQGFQTVDKYVDEFCEMIKQAQYFEGAHIVLKSHQGLNPKIQDYIACLTSGQLSDKVP